MVKGISRRVVVVRPEHSKVFEEAIFIVRDGGGPPCDALREACRVAERYLAVHPRRARPRRLGKTRDLRPPKRHSARFRPGRPCSP